MGKNCIPRFLWNENKQFAVCLPIGWIFQRQSSRKRDTINKFNIIRFNYHEFLLTKKEKKKKNNKNVTSITLWFEIWHSVWNLSCNYVVRKTMQLFNPSPSYCNVTTYYDTIMQHWWQPFDRRATSSCKMNRWRDLGNKDLLLLFLVQWIILCISQL